MAKRFTATEIWGEDWFLEMDNEYKLLWYFMLSKCDHAGVWKPNKKVFEITAGVIVDLGKGFDYFNSKKERIIVTEKKNWWIVDFFSFQYGTVFNINNKLHLSIYNIYNQENINLRTNRGLKEVKWWTWSGLIEDFDTLKEKDKDINSISKVKNSENGQKIYPVNFRAQSEELFLRRISEGEDKVKRNRQEDNSVSDEREGIL